MKLTTALSLLLPLLAVPLTVNAALDALMKSKGKQYFGTCLDPDTINVSQLNSIAKSTEFGAFTPENSAKWQSIEPNRNQFSWSGFDTLVNFAQSNGKKVRGHTLVWHNQLPSWVSSISNATDLTNALTNHVTQVVSRYKGKVFHWDVVNECLDDGTGNLRSSVFQRVLGESFIDIAFKAARAADPSAKLYINDYNINYAGNKLNGMVSLINRLKSRGVPIDGVGTQTHTSINSNSGFQSTLQTLANTGLDVAITELDIAVSSSSQFSTQQNDYNIVVKACMNVPKCVGITTWGISDNHSWISSKLPLLWNSSFQKKPAYTGAESAINGS